jgi:hypothetical protein|nr:MAG TPA: hypothetical protein [Caudoviricetes sp.]
MKLEKSKKLEIKKVGRKYVEAVDIAFNGKKVKIVMNDNFTKEMAKGNLDKVIELNVNVEFKNNSYMNYTEVILHPVDLEKISREAKEKATLKEIESKKKGIDTMLYYVKKYSVEGKKYQNGIDVINDNLKEIERLSKNNDFDYIEKIKSELKGLELLAEENNNERQLYDFDEPYTVGQEFKYFDKLTNKEVFVRVKKAWRYREPDALSMGGYEDNQWCYCAIVEIIN